MREAGYAIDSIAARTSRRNCSSAAVVKESGAGQPFRRVIELVSRTLGISIFVIARRSFPISRGWNNTILGNMLARKVAPVRQSERLEMVDYHGRNQRLAIVGFRQLD